MKKFILLASVLTLAPLSVAQANTSDEFRAVTSVQPAPTVLSKSEKNAFSDIYTAIRAQKWDDAAKLIDKMPAGPMAAMARAELYLAPNSPKVDAPQLQTLLNAAPYLPQAEQLEIMARKRGADALPDRPGIRRFAYLGGAPKRDLPTNVAGDGLRGELQAFIKNDDPRSAEALLDSKSGELSTDALTELRYRVAWSYYIENDDASAKRLAGIARVSGGEWGTQGQWVYALQNKPAAFRSSPAALRDTTSNASKAAEKSFSRHDASA